MSAPRIGALFAGYGGLDMAVTEVYGGEMAWYSEVDKGALKILEHRFPDVPNVGDVTTADWSQVEPVDILTGGSPCQDLSHAGRRAGMTEGTRSNLWVAMREAIAQLRPRLVVWENVRGALSAPAESAGTTVSRRRRGRPPRSGVVYEGGLLAHANGGPTLRALGRVLGDLSDLGYDAQWHGLRAADVGAPHGRWRVFLTAYPASDQGWVKHGDGGSTEHSSGSRLQGAAGGRLQHSLSGTRPGGFGGNYAAPCLPSLGEACGRCHRCSQEATGLAVALLPTPTVQDGANTGGASQFDRNSIPLNALVTLLPTPAVNDMGAGKTPEDWDAWTDRMKAEHGNGNGHGKSLAIEAQRLLPTPSVADAMGGHERRGGARGDELLLNGVAKEMALLPTPRVTQAGYSDDGRGGKSLDVEARRAANWGDYAAAIARWEHVLGRPAPAPTMTSAKGNPQLSPAFVEWLMGLPEGWVTDVPGITRNEALKALGNGVVSQQAAAALRLMLGAEVAA